jgi:uncharacterized protein (DUF305 family)
VFNDADVAFAQQMIMHHRQAVEMAEMAQSRAQDPRVKRLATQNKAEQQPQIETMTRWLQARGRPLPGTTPRMSPNMPGMTPTPKATQHMPSMTPHMPTPALQPSVSQMMNMRGVQFDWMFLNEMIAHHEEAVSLAKTELASGANPQAKQLAKSIQTSQSAQLIEMRKLLASASPAHT